MDGPITSNPTAPRVWEAYIDATGVFKAQGAPPDPWGGRTPSWRPSRLTISRARRCCSPPSKNVLSEILQASFGKATCCPPIADLNGKYVFYEIHLNKPEYDYIVSNTLYSEDGQTAFLAQPNATISFPQGSRLARRSLMGRSRSRRPGSSSARETTRRNSTPWSPP